MRVYRVVGIYDELEQDGRIIREERDGFRLLVDLTKGDQTGAIAAVENVLAANKEPKTELDRIGIVIFGDTDQKEELRMLPVGLAEFPEGAAEGVKPRGSHVHPAALPAR